MFTVDKYNFSWTYYGDHLKQMLHDMLTDELTDVTLVTEDQQQINAHKSILSACSMVFKSIFKNKKVPSQVVYLRGINSQELQLIINFIYTGQVECHKDVVNDMINVAKNLKIKDFIDENNSEKLPNVNSTNHSPNLPSSALNNEIDSKFSENVNKSVENSGDISPENVKNEILNSIYLTGFLPVAPNNKQPKLSKSGKLRKILPKEPMNRNKEPMKTNEMLDDVVVDKVYDNFVLEHQNEDNQTQVIKTDINEDIKPYYEETQNTEENTDDISEEKIILVTSGNSEMKVPLNKGKKIKKSKVVKQVPSSKTYACFVCKFKTDTKKSIREHANIEHAEMLPPAVEEQVTPTPVNTATLPNPASQSEYYWL